jgi:hypothetical protein
VKAVGGSGRGTIAGGVRAAGAAGRSSAVGAPVGGVAGSGEHATTGASQPSSGGVPGGLPEGAIGLAALLGILGLAALRGTPGLSALQGTGAGMRLTAHALLTFPWSGSCASARADASGSQASFERAILGSDAGDVMGAVGGRGAAKGALDLTDPAAGGRDLPPGLALVALPRGGGGPTAALSGLLLVASAFVGALLARLLDCVRSDPGEERA